MDEFDYVIIGGGTAACVLAYRLSEGDRNTVCVLEAGPKDDHFTIRIPAGFIKNLSNPRVSFQYFLEPSEGTNNRRIQIAQGRMLGGSSSLNGMIFNRGQAADYNYWAQLGNRGWGYDDVLPYFKRFEKREGPGDDRFRGRDGLLVTCNSAWDNPLIAAFMESAAANGVPRNMDHNGETQFGHGWVQAAVDNTNRASTAHAFLRPAERRQSVTVRTEATVTRIVLDGKRATGVEYRAANTPGSVTVRARKSVILSAGALNGPKLLQLSGIGPAGLLSEFGIPVQHDLPGVGENLSDHFGCRVVAKIKGATTLNGVLRFPRLQIEALKWALSMPNLLSNPVGLVNGFGKSHPDLDEPDFYFTLAPASFKAGFFGKLDDYPGVTCAASPMRPESRGYVRIQSTDIMQQPIIQPNYLSTENDRRLAVHAASQARKMLQTGAMAQYFDGDILPGPNVQTYDEMLDFVRSNAMSGYHYVGTCKMAPATDKMAVVDDRLRVHGLEGLHIVDASIIPRVTSANTCVPTIMVAEKASDMLLGKPPLSPLI